MSRGISRVKPSTCNGMRRGISRMAFFDPGILAANGNHLQFKIALIQTARNIEHLCRTFAAKHQHGRGQRGIEAQNTAFRGRD